MIILGTCLIAAKGRILVGMPLIASVNLNNVTVPYLLLPYVTEVSCVSNPLKLDKSNRFMSRCWITFPLELTYLPSYSYTVPIGSRGKSFVK